MTVPVRRPWWFPRRLFYAAFDEGYRHGYLLGIAQPVPAPGHDDETHTSLLRQRVEQRLRKAQRDAQGAP